jgi:ribosomal protein L9
LAKKNKPGGAATAGSATKVQVRLKQYIAGTGQAGDIVLVTPAFFNNKLRPQGLAERITDEQKEAIEEAQEQEREETLQAAENLQQTLGHDQSDFVLRFTDNKTGPDGKKMFGGINAKKLMDALQNEVKDDFLQTHKQVKVVEVVEEESGKKVKNNDIKQTGDYLLKLQLTQDLFVKIKVMVE